MIKENNCLYYFLFHIKCGHRWHRIPSQRNTSQLQSNPSPFRVICFFPLWCFLRTALKVIPLTNQGLHFSVFKHFFCLIPNSPRIKLNVLKMKSNALHILICFPTSLYTFQSWHPLVLHQIPYS